MKGYKKKYKDFRTFLAEIRRAKGVTQAELAKRLGQRQNFISKCESGERRLDLIEFLLIAEALGIEPNEFIRKLSR